MTTAPIEPWVNWTRQAILWIGFGWPIAIYVANFSHESDGAFAAVGVLFMATLFLPVALVVASLLSTHKLRILLVPPILVAVFWWVSSQSATYDGFSLPPYMILWITTFTAITLLLPQGAAVTDFFRRKQDS